MASKHGERRPELSLDLKLLQQDDKEEIHHHPKRLQQHPMSLGFCVTYGAFFFAGASAVAMWSCITLCLDFFQTKYPLDRVSFVFPVVNMSTLLVISLYMVLAGRQLPLAARMHGSLAVYLLMVLLLPLANLLELSHNVAYPLTLIAIIGSTISSSIMQSTVYGLGGVFGPLFIQAIEGGKGFGAILLFVVRLALKGYFQGGDAQHSAKVSMAVFFCVAFVMVAITWALYVALTFTEFAEPLMEEYLVVQHGTPFNEQAFSPLLTPTSPVNTAVSTERSPLIERTRGISEASWQEFDDVKHQQEEPSPHAKSAELLVVLRVAAKPFFSLFLSYFICLSSFPGIITAIPSVTLQLGDWFPIVLVGCYSLGDWIGKTLPVYVMYLDVQTLHRPWALQCAMLPFFILALLHPFEDTCVLLAVLLLGLTTGYVATSSMILAPSVCDEFQKEVAGMVGGLCAIIGLCVGSYNGLAIETLISIWSEP